MKSVNTVNVPQAGGKCGALNGDAEVEAIWRDQPQLIVPFHEAQARLSMQAEPSGCQLFSFNSKLSQLAHGLISFCDPAFPWGGLRCHALEHVRERRARDIPET